MPIVADAVAFIYHNLMAEGTIRYLLVVLCTAEGVDNQVVFFRYHHKTHTLHPVTKTVVLEIFLDRVFLFFFLMPGGLFVSFVDYGILCMYKITVLCCQGSDGKQQGNGSKIVFYHDG